MWGNFDNVNGSKIIVDKNVLPESFWKIKWPLQMFTAVVVRCKVQSSIGKTDIITSLLTDVFFEFSFSNSC